MGKTQVGASFGFQQGRQRVAVERGLEQRARKEHKRHFKKTS